MYRSESPAPDRICIVCYSTVSLGPSKCGRDGAPLVPLEEPEVVAELRKRARAKLARPARRRLAIVMGSGFALALIGFVVLVYTGLYDLPAHMKWTSYDDGLLELWPFWGMWLVFSGIFAKLAGGLDVVPSSFDAETATPPALLDYLGLLT
jgi:hypothetical protein